MINAAFENLSHTGGNLNVGSTDINISGNFTRSGGTLNAGSGTITFNGGTFQNLTLNDPTEFYNLSVANGNTLVETVANDNASAIGELSNQGIIRKSMITDGVGPVTFGLTGTTINITTLGTLSEVLVDRIAGDHPNANSITATGRHWSITPTGSGYTLDLTLIHYLPNDTDSAVCRFTGSEWDCARTSSTASTVTWSGVTALSDWAIGNLGSTLFDNCLYLPFGITYVERLFSLLRFVIMGKLALTGTETPWLISKPLMRLICRVRSVFKVSNSR